METELLDGQWILSYFGFAYKYIAVKVNLTVNIEILILSEKGLVTDMVLYEGDLNQLIHK